VLEKASESLIPAFRHSSDVLDNHSRLGVVVDVEVRCGENLEVEIVVLDLVSAEILSLQGTGRKEDQG
jgi:hypothetical protein